MSFHDDSVKASQLFGYSILLFRERLETLNYKPFGSINLIRFQSIRAKEQNLFFCLTLVDSVIYQVLIAFQI